MRSLVLGSIRRVTEEFGAGRMQAGVRALAGVRPSVDLQVLQTRKRLAAAVELMQFAVEMFRHAHTHTHTHNAIAAVRHDNNAYIECLLPPPKKEVMFLVWSVCLFVCLSVGLLANL